MELERHREEFRKLGLGVAAISYDSPAVLKSFAERRGIAYPLLSDPASKIIRDFGILNETMTKNSMAYGVPHPVTYLVDPKGVVKERFFEQDYRERVTAADILVRQFGQKVSALVAEKETPRLKLSMSSSSAVVRGGHRIALVLEVEIRRGLKLYAPGSQEYHGIDWRIDKSDAWAIHDFAYPPSRKTQVPGLPDPAPVYSGKIRLVREITIGQAQRVKPALNQARELVVSGAFHYQACNDRECFLPDTLPLEWRLRFEDHDSERAPPELRRQAPR